MGDFIVIVMMSVVLFDWDFYCGDDCGVGCYWDVGDFFVDVVFFICVVVGGYCVLLW